jgi:hypothetical protein
MKKSGYCISIALLVLFTSLHAMAQSKRHPVGMIIVNTEVPGNLVIDTMPDQKMTIYHQVVVSGINIGMHTLTFKHDSITFQKRIFVAPGQTNKYVIQPDSIRLNSTVKGRYLNGYNSSVQYPGCKKHRR